MVAGGLDELAELVPGDFGGRERVGFRQSEAADGHVRFDRRIAWPREDLAKLPRRDERELHRRRIFRSHARQSVGLLTSIILLLIALLFDGVLSLGPRSGERGYVQLFDHRAFEKLGPQLLPLCRQRRLTRRDHRRRSTRRQLPPRQRIGLVEVELRQRREWFRGR